MQTGPSDPLNPIGYPEMLSHQDSGIYVIRQQYADGYIYEYMTPRGYLVDPHTSPQIPYFKARLLRSHEEGGFTFISVWVPNEETKMFEDVYERAAKRPDMDYDEGPQSELEVLVERDHCKIARERYTAGWMYHVTVQFGFPWPSFHALPELLPTRIAPVISIEPEAAGFTARFWVADNSPYAP